MKSVDLENLDDLPGRRIEKNDEFHFECRSDLSCFNLCCRNLNLFLYPYDVVRLKNSLGLSSGDFIDRHTDVVLRPGNFFPDVLLRMADNDQQTCPFLTDQGCSVYPDRPDTCRTFPVEQGMIFKGSGKPEPVYFFRPPDFCEGRKEKRAFTLSTWAKDQDAATYNTMTVLWAEVKTLFMENPWGLEGPSGPRAKMAFMAAYNVDSFRDFIFGSSFLKRYKVKPEIQKKLKKNDGELMKFGFAFIKTSLFGLPTSLMKLKS
jgi:Fe-S-cluster containining protein